MLKYMPHGGGCISIDLIPMANSVQEYNGSLKLNKIEAVYTEIELPLVKNKSSNKTKINIFKNDALKFDEYNLTVENNEVSIEASDKTGAYYALQSLRMIGHFDDGICCVPFVKINDSPQYAYRGISIDDSRHFFGKDYVKKVIDIMFMLKLNVLHWHLTDDQGWRIEILKYPLLTEIGSKRSYSQIGGWNSTKVEEKECSGFYTQEDIREIVDYAAERCVNIMPEIDVPAHFGAAIAAYPNIACRNLKTEVFGYFSDVIPKKQGIESWNRPVCLGKRENIDFILDIYNEVADLFPFKFFHIGGDECKTDEWSKCPDCRQLMEEKEFKKESELQNMLTSILCDFLKQKGKRAVGWNEILNGGEIDRSVVVQCWENKPLPLAVKYAENGGNIIMSNHKSFYFDMPYAMYPLKNTYDFTPSRYSVTGEAKKNVLGVEGEMWAEWITNSEKHEMQSHPRAEALAEVGWTKENNKSYEDFLKRYNNLKGIYEKLNINRAADKISMPKNKLKRLYIMRKQNNGNPDFEFLSNKKLLKKEEAASAVKRSHEV